MALIIAGIEACRRHAAAASNGCGPGSPQVGMVVLCDVAVMSLSHRQRDPAPATVTAAAVKVPGTVTVRVTVTELRLTAEAQSESGLTPSQAQAGPSEET